MDQRIKLPKQWGVISLGERPAKLSQRLEQSIKTAMSIEDDKADDPLENSIYSSDSLPQPEPPTKGISAELENAKARFAALHAQTNTGSPAYATSLLDTLTAGLDGFYPDIAGLCAEAVQSLMPPVEFLASRVPREHRHAAHRDNIRESRDALDSYRDIRADKIPQLTGSEKLEEMRSARESTASVRSWRPPGGSAHDFLATRTLWRISV
jgi:hypothetical protein